MSSDQRRSAVHAGWWESFSKNLEVGASCLVPLRLDVRLCSSYLTLGEVDVLPTPCYPPSLGIERIVFEPIRLSYAGKGPSFDEGRSASAIVGGRGVILRGVEGGFAALIPEDYEQEELFRLLETIRPRAGFVVDQSRPVQRRSMR